MSINRAFDKEDVVHTYDGMLAIKKNEIRLFAATWMDVQLSYSVKYIPQRKINII